MSGKMKIKIKEEVNPNFKNVWTSKKPYNILKGGRNSFKSSVIALKLAYMLIQHINRSETANIVIVRKIGNTIRDSVYLKMQWALSKFFMLEEFKTTVAPFKIIHKATDSTIYFYGQDDFQKLKSNDIGNIIAVWYEEAAEFDSFEEFDQTNITFMRQKHEKVPHVMFFWSYNPPRNPYSWINEWSERCKEYSDYLVHESSYLDDTLGFITDQMLSDIERIKSSDYEYYRYIYLGVPTGIGNNVYNMDLFQRIDAIPEGERLRAIFFSTDTGHSVSATTTLAFGQTFSNKIILLDTDYYSPVGKSVKRSPVDHCRAMHDFYTRVEKKYQCPVLKKTVDSADGAIKNQYYNLYGEMLSPVSKGRKIDMIDYVIDLLANGRFFYLDIEANKIFIDEHKQYRFEESTIKTNPDNPEVVKIDDHTPDAFQYFVKDNIRELGLKV